MADEESLHRCVTRFMHDTCCRTSSEYADDASFIGASAATFMREISGPIETLPSGSSAELYIKPMLSCIGDIDIMFVMHQAVAIPTGYAPPTEMSAGCQQALEIADSHKPGYVYLRAAYVYRESDGGRCVAERVGDGDPIGRRVPDSLSENREHVFRHMNPEIERSRLLQSLLTPDLAPHGPAFMGTIGRQLTEDYGFTLRKFPVSILDVVPCLYCPFWPSLATDWPQRNRDHGWPDQQTVDSVVGSGCHVVRAVHPLCRGDEWMNEHQWRLSFSRAEVVLINSWTPVQQIIYHMLRFVVKREILSEMEEKYPDFPKLSNYHIKTLMLWECEHQPRSWWSEESSLVRLCSSLLQKLSGWVADRHCPHYFLDSCNLLDHLDDAASQVICNRLARLAEESFLLHWFVDNYIRTCAQQCPQEVSALFESVRSSDKLETAICAVAKWKLAALPRELYLEHHKLEAQIAALLYFSRSDSAGIDAMAKQLRHSDQKTKELFVALAIQRVSYTVAIHSLTEDLLNVLWTLLNLNTVYDDTNFSRLESGPLTNIGKAITLMTASSDTSSSFEMLYYEMSKAYLRHSFTYRKVSTYGVVHLLLAVLYYKTGQYQEAMYHSIQTLNRCGDKDWKERNIGIEYLPQIDDSVDSVIGLTLLYLYVQHKSLNLSGDQFGGNGLAFTSQLLAQYIYSKCSTVTDAKPKNYRRHLFCHPRPLLTDVLLFKAGEPEMDKLSEVPSSVDAVTAGYLAIHIGEDDRSNSFSSMDTGLLVTMLELVALEKLIAFRQVTVRELHSEQFPILNEFEALHAYKCGLYDECLTMCRNHVHQMLLSGCSRNQLYEVSVQAFLSLMDGELLSLFGLISLLHPVHVMLLLEFPDFGEISMLTLSLYLMVECQKRLGSDSLLNSLRLIRHVHDDVFPADNNEYFIDRSILKLIYRSLRLHLADFTSGRSKRFI